MSIRVTSEVWELNLPQHLKFVLMVLADHAHDDGTRSFPGKNRIAYKVNKTPETVKRILGELRDLGLIVPTAHAGGGRGNATEYTVIPAAGDRVTFDEWLAARKGSADDPVSDEQRGTPVEPKRSTGEVNRGTPVAVKGVAGVPPTIINHPSNHQEPSPRCRADLDVFGHGPCPVPSPCWIHDGHTEFVSVVTENPRTKERKTAVRDKEGRRRDPLFEAIALVTGMDPLAEGVPRPEVGRLRAAVRDLRDAGAMVSEVIERASLYVRRWPDMELTPTALAANWVRVQVDAPADSHRGRIADALRRFEDVARDSTELVDPR